MMGCDNWFTGNCGDVWFNPKRKHGKPLAEQSIIMTSHWPPWRLKSSASREFAQPFVQVNNKENTKALRHCPLWGKSTGDHWIPRTIASNAEIVSNLWCHHENLNKEGWSYICKLHGTYHTLKWEWDGHSTFLSYNGILFLVRRHIPLLMQV